ncbi:hypothetical protein [Kineosporia sp. NBRC 101731]|uniref:hypothetical protein n=1 Tax=Kineosporia sp. NBRC 101731 TaxID=3032199 RepID=UPI0024A5864E|nr:hypothetical protein [Kineosporia sp. NBRC 101731]GLY32849.1 hypothetical protein Kisp02_62140 [Kineosporia sp. NBRC 101731]
MARLLIISRSLALGMRLTDLHEVDERSADDLEQHLPQVEGFDVLVLDVGDPVLAVNTVNSLREDEQAIPVMLVSGYQPEWEQVEAQQVEGVHVVPLPITRQALHRGVGVLLDGDPDEFIVEPTGAMPVSRPAAPVPPSSPDDEETVRVPAIPAPTEKPTMVDVSVAPAASPTDGAPRPGKAGKTTAKAGPPAAVETPASAKAPVPPGAGQAPGPADVAAAKAVQKAAEAKVTPALPPAEPNAPATGPLSPSTGRLGQQIAARRLQQTQSLERLGSPQHDRNRPMGSRPQTPRPQTEAIEVTPSQVAGLSYSSPVVRPFSEQPPAGHRPTPQRDQNPAAPAGPDGQAAPSRWRPAPAPETGSINLSGNMAANRRMQRLGDRPRKFQRRTGPAENTPRTPGRGLVTDPLGPRTDPYGFPVSALERRLDAEAAASLRPGLDGEPGLRTGDLIRMLAERTGELYGVSDTSQVLADDVIERASADAAAVLVPDGPIWRVSGGVGLRPAERRLELNDSHWLITEIGSAGRAVLIDDTDIVRQQLAGAPLAAWRHLLALPVPDVRVIVVMARGDEGEPFSQRDLSAVYPPVRESAVLLAQAIETRRLARALAPLREPEPESDR